MREYLYDTDGLRSSAAVSLGTVFAANRHGPTGPSLPLPDESHLLRVLCFGYTPSPMTAQAMPKGRSVGATMESNNTHQKAESCSSTAQLRIMPAHTLFDGRLGYRVLNHFRQSVQVENYVV